MKKVLLVTDGFFHPTYAGRRALHMTLRQLDGFSFQHVSSLEKLPSDSTAFSAFVLHFHHQQNLSDAALRKFQNYVSQGGGVLAIHAATASFKESLPYFEIIGGQFIGHGPVETFTVLKVRDDIFHGIDNFTVRDELYIHKLQPGIEVHYTARHNGEDVPVVWTHRYGQGKVCYAVPGHTTGSMQNKTYQQLLQRGLQWVTS